MMFVSLLIATLPLAVASPVEDGGHIPRGRAITDLAVLAELKAQHADALHKYNTGEAVFLTPENIPDHQYNLSLNRRPVVFGLAGFAILETAAASADPLATLGARLHDIITQNDYITREDKDYCRLDFQTHAGGDEVISIYANGTKNTADTSARNAFK